MMTERFWCCFVIFAGLGVSARAESQPTPLVFERDVQPLLKSQCFHCHGEEEELSGGLDLRLRRLLVKGGDSGAALVPEKPEESLIIQRLRAGEMPPPEVAKPLSASEINRIADWINQGANTAHPEPEEIGQGLLITEEDRRYWAYQPIRRPEVPSVQQTDLIANPIDAFILKRLETEGLTFSPLADRTTLIRRAYYDLLGLPPTPSEVAAFVEDASPDAWERLIDRLLASPHYGERWARHWLDVAGYADSEGVSDDDTERKWAWRYRDYVIQALAADKPFDVFIQEQLAGDELVKPPYKNLTPEEIEQLTATGFLRMAPDGTAAAGIDKGVAQNQVIADTLDIVTGSLLGLTVKCAQCHEHRYDPISHADYHQLRAVFEPALNWKSWRTPANRLIPLISDADREQADQLEAEAKLIDQNRLKQQEKFIEAVFQREIQKVPAADREAVTLARNLPVKKRTKEQAALLRKHPNVNVSAGSLYLYDKKAAEELKKLVTDAKAVRDQKPEPQFVRALTEVPGQVPKTFVFDRGDHEQPKAEVVPAGLTILSLISSAGTPVQFPLDDPDLPTTGRRLAFANWLTTGTHPLVTRVLVNRAWRNHFGRGIVETPSDFGRLGDRPSHPELLDWLATEFVRRDWSLKQLHRLMLTSRTYQQTVCTDPAHQEKDPDNRLFGGANLRRVGAEVLRDSILSVSGQLNQKPFGPPVPVMADRVGQWVIGIENLNAGRPGEVIPMHGEDLRRSVYVQVRRSRPLAVLDTFDAPRMEPNCDARSSSTVAPQSLLMMNGDFPLEQSERFADRLKREAGENSEAQIVRAWQLAFCRDPEPQELQNALDFLTDQTRQLAHQKGTKIPPACQALASLCQVLLGSNEFLYVD